MSRTFYLKHLIIQHKLENCYVIFTRQFVLKYESIPVHRPVPSSIHPAAQLHTEVAQAALAGQLPAVLAQSVAEPSAFTVKRTFIALLKHADVSNILIFLSCKN